MKGGKVLIALKVEIEDADNNFEVKKLTLPCNLRTELTSGRDYIIVDCEPHIPEVLDMDVWELNNILDEINCENPSMTEDFFSALVLASEVIDLTDEEFIRRVKENDFFFSDVSKLMDYGYISSEEAAAARYLVHTAKLPFHKDLTKEQMEFFMDETVDDFISWESVWDEYSARGFQLIEGPGVGQYYLIYWA